MSITIEDSKYYNDVCVIKRLYGDEVWVRVRTDFGVYNSVDKEYEYNTESFHLTRFNLGNKDGMYLLAQHLDSCTQGCSEGDYPYDGIKFRIDRNDLTH